ncbi:unnamed protein product [Cyclocybe aegerita]|uniref:5-formyltetrahydrofolate cyclo-ligase n=1 Tax=Cyclocybe aegerita TaxID=1973307 RepID=A0A8S0XRT7_CYCAE|nr:unnamed protein product [Cyclocybe aegerita]
MPMTSPSPSFAALAAASASTTLQAQKRALRRAVAARLAGVEERSLEEQSRAITARVLALPFLAPCTSISCYLSMPSAEARTGPLVETLLEAGKNLYVPKIASAKDGRMDFLRVYDQADLEDLPSGTWGIREPGEMWDAQNLKRGRVSGTKGELDVILVPGVAFDRSLSRLGHGKGYYDRFITSYVASGRRKPLLGASFFHTSV